MASRQRNRRHYGNETEMELEMIIITDDMWTDMCLYGHKLTSSPTWREFEWKTKMNTLFLRLRDTATLQNYAGESVGSLEIILTFSGIAPSYTNTGVAFQ